MGGLSTEIFCLDFAVAFTSHYYLLDGFQTFVHHPKPLHQFSLGALAGLSSALVIFPIDVVRHSTSPQKSFAWSSITFTSVYLGLYFSFRKETPASQLGWAALSSTLAVIAEYPLDYAKRNMFGHSSLAYLTNAMRIPLATALLFSYDQIILAKKSKV